MMPSHDAWSSKPGTYFIDMTIGDAQPGYITRRRSPTYSVQRYRGFFGSSGSTPDRTDNHQIHVSVRRAIFPNYRGYGPTKVQWALSGERNSNSVLINDLKAIEFLKQAWLA